MSNPDEPPQDESSETDTTFVFADCVELCGYILCLASVVSVWVGVIAFFHYYSIFNRDHPENHSGIIPHNHTQRLLLSLSPDMKPCDDFYEFVCAGWIRNHTNGSLTVLEEIEKTLFREAAYALDEVPFQDPEEKTSAVWKAKAMFYHCHAMLVTMQDGSKAMENFLQPRIAFPEVKPMNTVDIINLLSELSLLFGVHILFEMEAVAVSHRPAIALSLSGQLMDWLQLRSRLEAGGRLKDFILSHLETLSTFGGRGRNALLESILQADAIILPQLTGGSRVILTTYELLPVIIGGIHGSTWVNVVNNHTKPHFTVSIADDVKVEGVGSFKRVGKLLTGVNGANPLLLPTFIGWHLVRHLAHRASFRLRAAGYKDNDEHYDSCFEETAALMPLAVSRPFVTRFPTLYSNSLVVSLFQDIRRHVVALLKTWHDTPLRARTLLKLQVMQVVVEQPDLAFNESALDAHYANFTPQENFLDTWLNATRAVTQQKMALLANGDTLATVELLPIEVRALYDPRSNTLFIPSGVIHATFADQNLSAPLVFAGLGAIIGHEIMHAMELVKVPVLKTECIRKNYREYDDALVEESVADFAALRPVYSAFLNHTVASGEFLKTRSPPTSFTEEQMFFLNYCFKLCSTGTPAMTTGYPTNRERCNVPLKNTKEFSAAFECGPQDKMNPLKKCTFWQDE